MLSNMAVYTSTASISTYTCIDDCARYLSCGKTKLRAQISLISCCQYNHALQVAEVSLPGTVNHVCLSPRQPYKAVASLLQTPPVLVDFSTQQVTPLPSIDFRGVLTASAVKCSEVDCRCGSAMHATITLHFVLCYHMCISADINTTSAVGCPSELTICVQLMAMCLYSYMPSTCTSYGGAAHLENAVRCPCL